MRLAFRHSVIGLSAAVALVMTAPPAGAQQSTAGDAFVGNWQGSLVAGAARLRIALAVSRDSLGALQGVLTSVDQGGVAIPATVALRADTLIVDVARAGIRVSSTISAAGDSLRGSFSQGGTTVPLDMGRVAAIAAVVRPQEPKPPFPYDTTNIMFESAPGVQLAGTLVMPKGTGPFPAAVLITGSGPQNRDEGLMGHKPFLVLADYLARHGIATLRCDDRGVAKSTGNFAAATSADFANDAEAALRVLRATPSIAADKVGLIGHSEGGIIAPMIAARTKDVAFIVLLAGPGVPGDSILVLQSRLLMTAAGAPPAEVERASGLNRKIYDVVKTSPDSAAAAAEIVGLERDFIGTLPLADRQATQAALDQGLPQMLSPWMRFFIRYDPRPTLRTLHIPVLALNGTLDLQVPYKENLSAIDAALKEAGNTDYRVAELPGLNHLFQTARTGSVGEYATIDETFSPKALELITTWINDHGR